MTLIHIGYVAVGKDDEMRNVELLDYAGATELEVERKVLAAAHAQGYKGTAKDRLQELGWWVEPIYVQQGEEKNAE